jgi:hypothetical protein
MSTINPDERSRRIGTAARPAVFVLAVLVQFLAPVMALLTWLGLAQPDPGLILVYVLAWVLIGLAAMWVPSGRSPYVLAAFILSYVAGLFLVIQLSTPSETGLFGILVIGGGYLVAIYVLALYFLRRAAIRRTREIGVDTTATVISAPVSGMVNYVQRQRLTLRFTDQQGVERYLRVGRTGGGWSAGDTIPIRYDPTRPGYKRGIIVDGEGPTLF